ncbi:hypothetical protein GW891_01550 [bacterium]|nr:hypothetical protein [bacterium]
MIISFTSIFLVSSQDDLSLITKSLFSESAVFTSSFDAYLQGEYSL